MAKNSKLDLARKNVFQEVNKLEKEFELVLDARLKKILKSIKGKKYSKSLQKRIDKELDLLRKESEALAIKSERATLGLSIKGMEGTSALFGEKLLKKSQIALAKKVNPLLSAELHSTNILIKRLIRGQIRKSINAGEGVVKFAKNLTSIDPTKVNIPKYIRRLESLARRATSDPTQMKAFKEALKRNEKYINNLTRAGEEGFQHLGLRRAGNKFLKDIESATAETIDTVVNEWAKKKALNQQKRVARTETNNAFHEYNFEYAYEAEHIIGIETYLSRAHPHYESGPDICDLSVGVYLFSEHGRDIPLPSYHPNCLCGMRFIFAE